MTALDSAGMGQRQGDILIVDDTPANLRILSELLRENDYKVRVARSGAMALTAVRAAPPELILLDINMPDMNGYEVCQALKADARTRNIPVIFVSALSETLDKVRAFGVGGVDYLSKPIQFEEALARIQTHLSLHRLKEALEERVLDRTRELEQINLAYERFVPREFLGYLGKRSIVEVRRGDHVQREMSLLFADIRGFTSLSERMTPKENFEFLNQYLHHVSPIVREHNGFIDKYIGDAIMALFPESAADALRAANALHAEVVRYNTQRADAGHAPIRIGIGVHTGSLMMGILGEAERLQGTVISDAVNVASRLEGLTKTYGASVLASERTLRLAEDANISPRFVGAVRVKGKQEPVSIFEIFDGDPAPIRELKRSTKPEFEEGLRLYQERSFAEASVCMSAVLRKNPEDRAARLYLERSARHMVTGVPADWTAVEVLIEK